MVDFGVQVEGISSDRLVETEHVPSCPAQHDDITTTAIDAALEELCYTMCGFCGLSVLALTKHHVRCDARKAAPICNTPTP